MARHKNLIPRDFDGQYTEDMLTERQKQVLDMIRDYARSKGYPPSVREICKAVGLSSTATIICINCRIWGLFNVIRPNPVLSN